MNFSDLVADVLIEAPGCPEPIAISTLRRTAIKFCRESHVWVEQINDLYPVNDVTKYKVTPPDDTQIIAIASMVHHKGESEFKVKYWPLVNPLGYLSFPAVPELDQGPIRIKVVLAPTNTANEMPDAIGEDYREGLIHGAVAKLVMMPGKDWSNPQMAAYHQSLYDEQKREAKFRRNNGNTEVNLRVSPRPLI